MRRSTPVLSAAAFLSFATLANGAEQGADTQAALRQAEDRALHFRTAECPTENCQLAVGPDDLPLGALLSYETCANDVRKSYVFKRGQDSWELQSYKAVLATGCPASVAVPGKEEQ
jgi:hypothetical protein